MKIFLANDHAIDNAGKGIITKHLEAKGHNVTNLGVDDSKSVDYPDFGHKCGKKVAENKDSMGIIICGTGIGISIAANKVPGIRCALCHIPEYAKLAREHNDANILALGARFTSVEDMLDIIDVFLRTPFEGGRHERRVNKIEQ